MKGVLPPSAEVRRTRGPAALSAKNKQVLAFMRDFFEANDQLPPAAVVADHFGFASKNTVIAHTARLIAHGELERNAVGKLRFVRPRKEATPCP